MLLGDLARLGLDAPLALWVEIDTKDATRHVLGVSQAGLGLPDRDDYAKSDANTLRVKAAYRQHAAVLLKAAGTATDANVAAAVETLLAFEGELAAASKTLVQRRDPAATYNPVSVAGLQTQAPGLDWQALLGAYTGQRETSPIKAAIVLNRPGFSAAIAQLAQKAPLDTWRDYLRVRLLDVLAPYGPTVLARSHFAYTQGAQRGAKETPPRVEEVIQQIGGRCRRCSLAISKPTGWATERTIRPYPDSGPTSSGPTT